MKKIPMMMLILTAFAFSETLFEVKDALNNKVLDVSTDGLRVMNLGDTLMVISSSTIQANIRESKDKALSRTFSVTTTSAKGKGLINALEVGIGYTTMSSDSGDYTNFSPDNIFLGLKSGNAITPGVPYYFSGTNNVFLGNQSGLSTTNGGANVFVGNHSGMYNITGYNNTFVGAGAGCFNDTESNTFIGCGAGFYTRTGQDNVFVGVEAGSNNDSGNSNIFMGKAAGRGGDGYGYMSTGYDNILIGDSCAYEWLYGNKNVIIGPKAGLNNISGTGNIFLGNQAGYNETGSDKLYIDNSGTSFPLIFGNFGSDSLVVNGSLTSTGNARIGKSAFITGKLGVGVSPTYKIHSLDTSTNNDDPAIYGKHNATNDFGIGVKGEGGYMGILGVTSITSGYSYGIVGQAAGTTGEKVGVYGLASGGGTNWAGYFNGNVHATGTITSDAKNEIRIDHPLDPENKILVHTGVNSNEMLNVYNGNAILDYQGIAVVELPEWFELYNTDFKYQLTPIGGAANLYISKEIKNNRFEISGGSPNLKVSWQITGTRNDNYAKINPVEVEKQKNSEDKGKYLHPEAYDMPEQMGIEYRRFKEIESRSK